MIPKRLSRAYRINKGPQTGNYSFITDSGIEYVIFILNGFRMVPGFNYSSQIRNFSFKPLYKNLIPKKERRDVADEKIMNTIVNFIIDLVEKNKEVIVVYTPSDEDHSREARIKYFHTVYLRNLKELFKMDYVFPVIGNMSFIFRKDNDYFADICSTTSDDIIRNVRKYSSMR